MKCLHTNDWHLWHLTPSSRLDNWPDTIFRKLDQMAEIAAIHQVTVIAVAGDLFNSINTSYRVVERLLRWCRGVGVPVVAIPGNHDERYNQLDSLPGTPLGTVFASGQILDVSYHPYTFDGVQIIGIPWPDAKDLPAWANAAALIDPAKPAVVLAHAFASKTGGQFFGQPVLSYEALAAYPFQVYHFGHDHSARASQKLNGKVFLNFGAPGRGSLAIEEIYRDVFVAVTELRGDGLFDAQLVKLKVEPAEKVFDLQRYAYDKSVVEQFEAGLGQQIQADFLAMSDDQSIASRVSAMALDDAVRARLLQYLTDAEEAVA